MEQWVETKFKNYFVSNIGRVKSTKKNKVIILKQQTDKQGYKYVDLFISNTRRFHAMVHRLVAKAFIPNPENKSQVNHKDGNKQNNSVENLEWVTAKENVVHSYTYGLANIGTKRHNHKLTKEQVIEIRKAGLNKSETYEELANQFNVDSSTIHDAAVGESYKDVDFPIVPIRQPIQYSDAFIARLYYENKRDSQHLLAVRYGIPQQTISKLIIAFRQKHGL